jgi:hypothetical protein
VVERRRLREIVLGVVRTQIAGLVCSVLGEVVLGRHEQLAVLVVLD